MLREQCIGFIGGGNMSEALIGGLIRTGRARPEQLLATDIVPARREFLAARFSISASSTSGRADTMSMTSSQARESASSAGEFDEITGNPLASAYF